MFTEKRTASRRTIPDRRSWAERRRNVRRRFIVEVDEDRRDGVEIRQGVRRREIRRTRKERRGTQLSPELRNAVIL